MALDYCLMVTGPAYGNQRASSALQFSRALLACGHRLGTVFFYQDGVHNANRLTSPSSDEVDLVRAWHELAQQHQVAMYVCVAAALRRGVIDSLHASLLKLNGENFQPGFEVSSLGKLAQMALSCDRFIQF
ncbi:sulfurtransferase complex subunit TusD [Candidatus Doolittlea endobia]|uniref:Sulfurtransferase TusD n=1 Tax=Candidatus Doolittlea endobia TaxID=1778262 RepID=A0A143WSG2_9ENTR|nr:sulfurtransferase complex subunit TusD [Candidatus Doolittlea endobia]CUX96658.1 Sulfurtransferase TusD [Candidatus Doolittlea endobia]